MAAPAARSSIELVIDGPLVSQPYVLMTLSVMESFGVNVDSDDVLQRFAYRQPRKIMELRDYADRTRCISRELFLGGRCNLRGRGDG